jgi:hypothetical protein
MAERRQCSAKQQEGMRAKRHEPRRVEKLKLSRRVKRILHLEGHAARFRAHYEHAMTRIAPRKHKAEELRQQALAIKVKLSPHEVHELRRIRSGV